VDLLGGGTIFGSDFEDSNEETLKMPLKNFNDILIAGSKSPDSISIYQSLSFLI